MVDAPRLFDDRPPRRPPGEEARTHTVSSLNREIARRVQSGFPAEVWVAGEIQDYAERAGNTFFQLAEKQPATSGPVAVASVALLAGDRSGVNVALAAAGGLRLRSGLAVRIRARVQFHVRSGRLSLRMTGVDPEFTLGKLAAERERVLAALGAAGLIDANSALALPAVPLHVGLVTSVAGAAYRDFLHELDISRYAFRVAVCDVRTQGGETRRTVVGGLRALARRHPDVGVIVRGGGAGTDLLWFDDETIARTIAAMAVPVLTGIGHEHNTSIADRVAHTSYKTPTAVAAALVERVRSYLAGIEETAARTARASAAVVSRAGERLDVAVGRSARSATSALRLADAAVAAEGRRLRRSSRRPLLAAVSELEGLPAVLRERALRIPDRRAARVDAAAAVVGAHDPAGVLARGFTITRDASGRVVRDVGALSPGDALDTEFAGGRVASVVQSATTEGPP